MALLPAVVKIVQDQLNKEFNLTLKIDGMAGAATDSALNHCVLLPSDWTRERKVTGYLQYLAMKNGIEAGAIDGKWGPQTQHAYEELTALFATGARPAPWRAEEGAGAADDGQWPKATTVACNAFYGEVGKNQGKVNSPYPLKIAWDTSKTLNRFTAHEKVCPSIERVLARVLDHYGDTISALGLDMWGGCLNVRKMRGGTEYSMHSWGIAIDWDPTRNQLKWGKDKANFAKPEYDKWWDLWEEEGWVSLGRAKNYDWMHVQAARVK